MQIYYLSYNVFALFFLKIVSSISLSFVLVSRSVVCLSDCLYFTEYYFFSLSINYKVLSEINSLRLFIRRNRRLLILTNMNIFMIEVKWLETSTMCYDCSLAYRVSCYLVLVHSTFSFAQCGIVVLLNY